MIIKHFNRLSDPGHLYLNISNAEQIKKICKKLKVYFVFLIGERQWFPNKKDSKKNVSKLLFKAKFDV